MAGLDEEGALLGEYGVVESYTPQSDVISFVSLAI